MTIPLVTWNEEDLKEQGFIHISLVTDDSIDREGWFITNPSMPRYLYTKPGTHIVKAAPKFVDGMRSLAGSGKKTTNTQKFRRGDWHVWPWDTDDDDLDNDHGWTVKGAVFERTYRKGVSRGQYIEAVKVGKVRAVQISVPFFVVTLDNLEKPYFYEAGSVLLEQVDEHGNSFTDKEKGEIRDFYANNPSKFLENYTVWQSG